MEETRKLNIPDGYEFDHVEYDPEIDSYKPKERSEQ